MRRLVLLSAAALLCGHVSADDVAAVRSGVIDAFEQLDKNADRQISRTEAGVDRTLSNRFAVLDTDGDGFLSREEFGARPKS